MKRRFHVAWLAIPLAALLACGGSPVAAPSSSSSSSSSPAFAVRDAAVVVDTNAPFTRSADFPARVESTIDAALAYWGGSWASLSGRTIVFQGSAHVECPGLGPSTGCYDGNIRLTTLDAGETITCVEATVLVHEVGHAVIGDAAHQDPRWMDFDALAERLVGRPGYSEDGATDCVPVANVWRHPAFR